MTRPYGTSLDNCRAEIIALRYRGFEVVELTGYQYRVNGTVDLYPKSCKFHNLQTGDRGVYKSASLIAHAVCGRSSR